MKFAQYISAAFGIYKKLARNAATFLLLFVSFIEDVEGVVLHLYGLVTTDDRFAEEKAHFQKMVLAWLAASNEAGMLIQGLTKKLGSPEFEAEAAPLLKLAGKIKSATSSLGGVSIDLGPEVKVLNAGVEIPEFVLSSEEYATFLKLKEEIRAGKEVQVEEASAEAE